MCPSLTVHTASILKCEPRTVISISAETMPLDGITLVTVGRESYAKSYGLAATSLPLTLTCTDANMLPPIAGGEAHSMALDDKTFAAAISPPNRHIIPSISKFSPTTVTVVPPFAGPMLGCNPCTIGDGTYLKTSSFNGAMN
jgi:hypothetical protein